MIADARDFNFLFSWLDVAALTTRERYQMHDLKSFGAVLLVSEQVAGESMGTMCMSEPHAGSTLILDATIEEF